jgi:hypothetical protein
MRLVIIRRSLNHPAKPARTSRTGLAEQFSRLKAIVNISSSLEGLFSSLEDIWIDWRTAGT